MNEEGTGGGTIKGSIPTYCDEEEDDDDDDEDDDKGIDEEGEEDGDDDLDIVAAVPFLCVMFACAKANP